MLKRDMIIESQNIANNIHRFNRWKENINFYTVFGRITKVDPQKYTVDVYFPSSSNKIYNISIANNIISNDKNLIIMPSVGQACVVGLSNSHKPILISVLASSEENVKVYENEAFISCGLSKIKMTNNNDLLSSSVSSVLLNNEGIYSFSKSSAYQTSTKINPELLSEDKKNYSSEDELCDFNRQKVLSSCDNMLLQLDDILLKVSEFITNITTGNANTIRSEVNNMKNYFACDSDEYSVSIESGDTVKNISDDCIFSIRGNIGKKEKTYFSISKDGTVEINCKNYIINKGDEI